MISLVSHQLQLSGSRDFYISSCMKANIYLFSISSHSQAIHINPLDITFLQPSIEFFKYDYFILTSKQAVESLQKYERVHLKPALCISEQTAKAYENIGGTVLEIGAGYGDNLESKIKSYSKEVNWLYLRAKVIASSFCEKLQEEDYCIDEKIVYNSECSKDILTAKVEDKATLIFTSPSSVKCFLKNNTIHQLSKVIVIGETTAKSLPKGVKCLIAPEKTIESCMGLINKDEA